MSEPVFVPGRPGWSAQEAIEVQRLIVAHRLTHLQFRALCGFAGQNPATARTLEHSTARALVARGLGEITGRLLGRGLTRQNPKAEFMPSELGRQVVALIREHTVTTSQASTNLTKVTINRGNRYEFGGKLTSALRIDNERRATE